MCSVVTPMSKHKANAEYVSVGQAATILNVHPNTVWAWVRSGELPAIRLGERIVRIYQTDLELFKQDYQPRHRKEVDE